MRWLLLLLLTGCAAIEDDLMCLDWKSYTVREDKCTALYGNLICIEQDVVRHYCVLWEEKDVASTYRSDC